MESLKLPKGGVSSGGSTSPTQTTTVGMKTNTSAVNSSGAGVVSVHFNASEESVDELFPAFPQKNNQNAAAGAGPADSGNGSETNATNSGTYVNNDLGAATQTNAVSPAHQPQLQQQQHTQSNIDEQARNFLQGNFFNRKRSGSIEAGISPTAASAAHSITAALAAASHLQTGDSTSVGTWKLIKGKVSQTIEDIKLSKSGSQNSIPIILSKAGDSNTAHDHDSDQENFILSSAITEEPETGSENSKQRQTQYHPLHKQHDSESEPEIEVLEGDPEHSRLRRGLAHLKSKVKSKAQANQQQISTLSATLASARSNVATLKTMKKDAGHSRRTEHSSEATDFIPPAPAATIITSTGAGTTLLAAQPSRTSLRTGFLRRRRKQNADVIDAATPTELSNVPLSVSPKSSEMAKRSTAPIKERRSAGIVAGRKDIEIESGVEMLEDMIPQATAALAAAAALNAGRAAIGQRESIAEIAENTDSVTYSTTCSNTGDSRNSKQDDNLPSLLSNAYVSSASEQFSSGNGSETAECLRGATVLPGAERSVTQQRRSLWQRGVSLHSLGTVIRLAIAHCSQNLQLFPALMMLFLFFLILLPIHDFLRGVFACLLSIALIEVLGKVLQGVIESFIARNQPERGKFTIPDYGKMPICKLPAVEEHKNCKFYAGWMNEADCYDPDIFHISQTKPIYVRLEGTVLLVSTTNARIPKRVMWNETPIELSKISFTSHRQYDLTDCRIELLPLGLARKRFFNRKYPIQLIIKNTNNGLPASANFMSDFEKSSVPDTTTQSTEQRDVSGASARSSVDGIAGTRPASAANIEADFGATILNADLQSLQDVVNPDDDLKEINVPCGDEVRLLLFSRGDREKEDWYRRFVNASQGKVHDQDLNLSKIKLVKEEDLQAAATKAAQLLTNATPRPDDASTSSSRASEAKDADDEQQSLNTNRLSKDLSKEDAEGCQTDKSLEEKFEGLLMSSCVARNPIDYVQFMALYQDACSEAKIPVYKNYDANKTAAEQKERRSHKHRRARVKETDLWRGIDQSLFLGPSGSVVWTNVVLGRVLFSCLNDHALHDKIQEFLQKKINSLRLPSYMEDVVITQIYLGDTPPLIHRISQPLLDERGIWLDADITYEGFANITVTTKLNLLRLKKPATRAANPNEQAAGGQAGTGTATAAASGTATVPSTSTTGTTSLPEISQRETREWQLLDDTPTEDLNSAKSGCAIYDSDAESTGGSDTETESPTTTERADTNATGGDFFAPTSSSPGNARRIFKLVDRFTTSNFFQYATELSYVQRAMENMSANITLRVDIKGLVGRGTINLPPPPSDRVWLCFRGPPRLWISGHPTVGDKSVDWSIVTNVIESKLCEEVNKYLVYPNMVDITIPFLAQPSYNSTQTTGAAAAGGTATAGTAMKE